MTRSEFSGAGDSNERRESSEVVSQSDKHYMMWIEIANNNENIKDWLAALKQRMGVYEGVYKNEDS